MKTLKINIIRDAVRYSILSGNNYTLLIDLVEGVIFNTNHTLSSQVYLFTIFNFFDKTLSVI